MSRSDFLDWEEEADQLSASAQHSATRFELTPSSDGEALPSFLQNAMALVARAQRLADAHGASATFAEDEDLAEEQELLEQAERALRELPQSDREALELGGFDDEPQPPSESLSSACPLPRPLHLLDPSDDVSLPILAVDASRFSETLEEEEEGEGDEGMRSLSHYVQLAEDVWNVLTLGQALSSASADREVGVVEHVGAAPWRADSPDGLPRMHSGPGAEPTASALLLIAREGAGVVVPWATLALPMRHGAVDCTTWCGGGEALMSGQLAWHADEEGISWAAGAWAREGRGADQPRVLLLLPYPHALALPHPHLGIVRTAEWWAGESGLATAFTWPDREAEKEESDGSDMACAAVDAVRDIIAGCNRDIGFKHALWKHAVGIATAQSTARRRVRASGRRARADLWRDVSPGTLARSPLLKLLVPALDRIGPGDGEQHSGEYDEDEADGRARVLTAGTALHLAALGLAQRQGASLSPEALSRPAPWVRTAAPVLADVLDLWLSGFGELPQESHATHAAEVTGVAEITQTRHRYPVAHEQVRDVSPEPDEEPIQGPSLEDIRAGRLAVSFPRLSSLPPVREGEGSAAPPSEAVLAMLQGLMVGRAAREAGEDSEEAGTSMGGEEPLDTSALLAALMAGYAVQSDKCECKEGAVGTQAPVGSSVLVSARAQVRDRMAIGAGKWG